MNLPNIFRVILEVADLNKAENFYSQLLGLKGRKVGGGRCYFDCGSLIFAILEMKKPQKIPQYIYFSVSDIKAIFERAKTLKCLSKDKVHDEPAGEIIERPWGEVSFYAEDPWGNGLCFVEENSTFRG